jgi:fatty-acyl-CoA synthase
MRTGSVQALLQARTADDGPGLVAGDQRWTWREYVAGSQARANAMRALLDDARPPHVGVLLENTPEMAFAVAAGALGGYVTAGLNLTRRGAALAADIRKADCQVILTDASQRPLLDGLDLTGVTILDTDAGRPPEAPGCERREVRPEETFMLIFTSGTSGAPKAVQVSNGMVAGSGRYLAERFGLGPSDVCYQAMPMFHSNAIMAGYSVALNAGATLALARRFSASGFLPDVRRYGATYANYVGKPLAYILRTPRRPDDADNPLRLVFGNEAADRDIAEFAQRFGTQVVDGFGSTENAVVVSRIAGTPPGSIGMPREGVAVYDRATRKECPRARIDATGAVTNLEEAVGELVNTQGAAGFQGYYNDREATEERLAGGFYWSGDLGYRDEAGWVYLAGRAGDWLRVDGENLGAGMVERILLRHPAVGQAAVYGVPDEHAGDQLVAALVLTGELEDFEKVLAAQTDLSPKAWPRYVRLMDELPSTATNKVLKRVLKAQGLDVADPLWIRDERGTAYRIRQSPTPASSNASPT